MLSCVAMFKRQKHLLALGRARWLPSIVLLAAIVALFGKVWLESDAFDRLVRGLFAAIIEPSTIPYVTGALILFGVGFVFLSNFRVAVERSRRKGGRGLRLGQGPLPDRIRFNAWLERQTGTVLGDLAAIGCWLLQAALAVFVLVQPLLAIGYAVVTGITLVILLKQTSDAFAGATTMLTVFAIAAILIVVFRRMPRTAAVLFLLKRRLHDRTRYAYRHLTRGVFTTGGPRREAGHEQDAASRNRERRRSLRFRAE